MGPYGPPFPFHYSKKYFYKTKAVRLNAEIFDSTVYTSKGRLSRIFSNGWYIDVGVRWIGRQIALLSQYFHWVEKKCFNQYMHKLVRSILIIAKLIHQFDKNLLNEGVLSTVAFSKWASRYYLRLQIERIQLYMLCSCIGLGILIVVWVLSLI